MRKLITGHHVSAISFFWNMTAWTEGLSPYSSMNFLAERSWWRMTLSNCWVSWRRLR